MSYTPPAGDGANFTWVGVAPYTPPGGDAAHFSWAPIGAALAISVFDGSDWVTATVKRWSGSAWADVTLNLRGSDEWLST